MMSDLTTKPELNTGTATAIEGSASKPQVVRSGLRLVVPTLVLVAYWALTEASYRIEAGMFYRFVTRIILLLSMSIYFLGWGLTRRHFTFVQRSLIFAMVLAGVIVGGIAGHPSTGIIPTAMIGVPIVLSLSIAWLWVSRHLGARMELTGIGFMIVAVFSVISQLRWDGLDGRQRTELSWRWTPSAEERFLQQADARPSTSALSIHPPLVESAADWPSFRGGSRESVVVGVELCDWAANPPRELWRRRIGPGWSSVIAIDDRLFTQEQRVEKEAVVCYDASTGQETWVHIPQSGGERFNESLSGTGPRATPTFHDNRIYAYGATGTFECLDAVTGELIWSHLLFSEFDAAVPQWGSASSPTIVDDLVVVFAGGKNGNSLLAFDRKSGELRWRAPGSRVSYSSPQVMTIVNVRQIVMHDTEGLRGLTIAEGKILWKHLSPYAVSFEPMLQPHLIDNDRLIVNWDAGLICFKVGRDGENWNLEEVWKSNKMKPSFNDFAIHDGHIYGLDDGILCCIDLIKGQRQWKRGRYGFGQLLMLPEQNELLVLTERGDVVRVALDHNELREIGSFKAIEGKTWNHPILVRGKLIVRNGEEMACFDIAASTATASRE
jgi:outer membrane protein assembly factor BamB